MAGQEDGLPYAERSQTPDLQSAGMPAVTAPSAGLLDMLGSGSAGAMAGAGLGGMNSAAVLGMMQPPSQASVYAAALSGGISAARGQADPVQAIQQNAQKQQNVMAQMFAKMQQDQRLAAQWGITNDRLQREESRREKDSLFHQQDVIAQRATARAKLQLGAYDTFLASATKPETRLEIAGKKAHVMEGLMGVPVPQNVVEGWALPNPVAKERNDQIIQAFNTAGDDPMKQQMVAQQFRLDPQSATFYSTMVKSDAFLEANGVKTRQQLHGEQIDREIKEQDLLDKKTPRELRGDPKYTMALRGMSQKLFPNREYATLSEPERTRVGDAVHNQMKVEEERTLRLRNELSTERLLAGIDARLAGKAAQPTNPLVVQKMVTPFQKADQLLDSVALIREKMKGIPDDALPSSDSLFAQKWAATKRATFYKGNDAIFSFQQLWAPITIGQIDRGYFDDKGVRIAAAFGKQLEVTDNLPTRKVMNSYLDTLEKMVTEKSLKDLKVLQTTPGTPAEVLEGAKGIMAPRMLKFPTTPLDTAPALVQQKQFMDMRKGSKNYGKAVLLEFSAGDVIPPGYVEIK